jgi:hypothetical protein
MTNQLAETEEILAETEEIHDDDKLFYHIPKSLFKAQNYNFDDIPPHAFTPKGDELSVNWEKYCPTAQDCLNIKTESYPNGRTAKTHGVGHFIAGEVRDIEFLTVVYSPSLSNKAHSYIQGIPPNKPKEPYNQMRKKLKRIFKYWDIRPELDSNELSTG